MPKAKPKKRILSVECDVELYDTFSDIVQRDGTTISHAVRAYMRAVADGEVSVRPRFRNAAR